VTKQYRHGHKFTSFGVVDLSGIGGISRADSGHAKIPFEPIVWKEEEKVTAQ
jgi:hypothetical protein